LSYAQISITSTDLLNLAGNSGSLQEDTTGSVSVNAGPAGDNQTWNFSALSLQGFSLDYIFLDPAETEQAEYFPTANLIQQTTIAAENNEIYYSFLEVNTDGVTSVGFIFTSNDSTLILPVEEEVTPLPISYGDSWISIETDTLEFEGGSVISFDSTFTTIDGWGNVTVPAGTFPCLRLRDNNTYISQSVFGDFVFADTTTTINYEWLTKDNFAVATIESMEGETNPDFSTAGFVSLLQENEISTSVQETAHLQAKDFILRQNYPNPFNPSTQIGYRLPVNSHVSLLIFDNLGRYVKSLVDTWQTAGSYSVEFDASTMASGIYYYKMQSADFSRVKRMLLVK